jgi:uncharacterized protein
VAVVTALPRYPVKSCRGEQLSEAAVEPWGPAGDRRWMVVDEDGCCTTARSTSTTRPAERRIRNTPVPPTASAVVDDVPAWAEDDWRELRIGAVTLRAVKGCDRCVMTTLDPDTAAKGVEPIATLARHRRWDGKTWFAVNLVPDTHHLMRSALSVRVGDEIEVISAVAPGDGPQR